MKVKQVLGGVSDLAVELFKVLFLETLTIEGSGAMALHLRVSTALSENLSSTPSPYFRQFTL